MLGPNVVALIDSAQRKYRAAERAREFELTDAGNAQRFARGLGAQGALYVQAWGWMAWDDRRWARDELAVRDIATTTAREIHAEAAAELDHERRKRIVHHAERSQAAQRISAMLWLAQPELRADPADFDRDPLFINVRNGTIDLATGDLRPHSREDKNTKIVDVDFDADAPAPTWQRFLETVQPNREVRDYIQRRAGSYLTAITSDQSFDVHYGSGANGKTTLLNALLEATGEYGVQADFSTFLQRRDAGIRNDLARLNGARLVVATEGPDGARLDAAAIKSLTGGDIITARFLHKEFFEFRPSFKLALATNHRPVIRDASEGMWRRVCLVPWEVTIPPEERDPELPDKLRNERAGILAWAVRGCLAWRLDGLNPPDSIRGATKKYRADQDDIGRWLAASCVLRENAKALGKELYRSYSKWCESEGLQPYSQRRLGDALRERGLVDEHTNKGNQWAGIGLMVDGDGVSE